MSPMLLRAMAAVAVFVLAAVLINPSSTPGSGPAAVDARPTDIANVPLIEAPANGATSRPVPPRDTPDNALPDASVVEPDAAAPTVGAAARQPADVHLPGEIAVRLFHRAALLDRCSDLPRDRTKQLLMIDAARGDQSRIEEELAAAFEDCANVPLADRAAVTDAYLQAAETGSPDALFAAAGRYPLGTAENVSWLLRAALRGHVEAQLTLARVYLARDNRMDTRTAFDWLRAAETQGSLVAEFQLRRLESQLPLHEWRELTSQ